MGTYWDMDWAWGLPLIVLTVVIHAYSLRLIRKMFKFMLTRAALLRNLPVASTIVTGVTVLSVVILHGFECFIWAGAFRLLGALPDNKSALLYSLNAMTSYGHENINLASRWQMLGAMEALAGWILFGLTTAFLFGVMQRVAARLETT